MSLATRLLNTSPGAQVSSALTGTLTSPSARKSSDNFSWRSVALPASHPTWGGIAAHHNGTTWVGVGYSLNERGIYSLDNGETWTSTTMPDGNGYNDVAYGCGKFTAHGANTGVFGTSTDGITWTTRAKQSTAWYENSMKFNGAIFANTTYQAHGHYSYDGITFNSITFSNNGTWMNMATSKNLFAAVQSTGTTNATSSPDGTTWTARVKANSNDYYDGFAGNGTVFCAIQNGSATGYTTAALVTWTSMTMPASTTWRELSWNGTFFIAISENTIAATSPDGTTWTQRVKPTGSAYTIASNQTRTIALGYNSELAYITESK